MLGTKVTHRSQELPILTTIEYQKFQFQAKIEFSISMQILHSHIVNTVTRGKLAPKFVDPLPIIKILHI